MRDSNTTKPSKSLTRRFKNGKRSGRQRGDAIPLPLTEPIAKRYLVDDLTVETLAPLPPDLVERLQSWLKTMPPTKRI